MFKKLIRNQQAEEGDALVSEIKELREERRSARKQAKALAKSGDAEAAFSLMRKGTKDGLVRGRQAVKKHKKTLRSILTSSFLRIIIVAVLTVGIIAAGLSYISTIQALKITMTSAVNIASDRVRHELNEYINIAMETGCNAALSDSATSNEAKQAILNGRAQTYGFLRGNLINKSGYSVQPPNDFSDQIYFQRSMQGEAYVSDPLISKITGNVTVIISAPLWKDGVRNGEVAGVVYYAPPETFLDDIMSSVQFSNNSDVCIINREGTTIAAADSSRVLNQENIIAQAAADPSKKNLAAAHQTALLGEAGITMTTFDGGVQLVSYAPIKGTDWVMVLGSPTADFLQLTYTGGFIMIGLLIVTILLATVLIRKLAAGIVKPIAIAGKRLEELAQGDVNGSVAEPTRDDEANMLLYNLGVTIHSLRRMVGDISEHLTYMANGDFTHQYAAASVGDFKQIDESLIKITEEFKTTLEQINQAARDVAAGADQMASGAQMLANGATTQASSLENVVMSVDGISDQIDASATNSEQITQRVKELYGEVTGSNEKMGDMLSAMADIREKSRQIGHIIKTIDDIAFQTNILALNAAVEAARAGEAGAGFSVVADEVRTLALKCAEAAKNTSQLIKESVAAVDNGKVLAEATAESLNVVVANTQEVTDIIAQITAATVEQARALNEVKGNVGNVSDIVQSNSATAQESAATSEELAGQADTLSSLLVNFKFE